MIINMSGAGAPGKVVTVHVPPEAGATVTCADGKKTVSAVTDSSCNAAFKLAKGPWAITAEKNGVSKTVNVTVFQDCTVNISLDKLPAFTYTGDFEVVDDHDNAIQSTLGNWKIRFLTSGTLTFTALNGAENGIDVFLVGGGGGGTAAYTNGGSGGGYTKNATSIAVSVGVPYTIRVGAGGSGGDGGYTSAFGATANGGKGATSPVGADGGSGGGAGWSGTELGSAGASDGGSAAKGSFYNGGTGQGTTTREFGDINGNLYSGGGGGASASTTEVFSGGDGGGGATKENGSNNTGGGGGAPRNGTATTGGSGIVIIRNQR